MKLSIKICSTSSKVVSRCLVLLITTMHYYSTSIMSWCIVYSLGVVVPLSTMIVKLLCIYAPTHHAYPTNIISYNIIAYVLYFI